MLRKLIERISNSPPALLALLIVLVAFHFASNAESSGVPGPEIDCLKKPMTMTMICRVERVGMLAESPWWTIHLGGKRVEIRTYILEFKYPQEFGGVDVRYRVNGEREWRVQEGIVKHGQ